MTRFLLAASLVASLSACRITLDDNETGDDVTGRNCVVNTSSATCVAATMHQDLTWIENNIFNTSCTFSGCHNGASSAAGKVDLRPRMSRAHLVGYASAIEPSRMLVVPNDVKSSYLMLMLHDFAPAEATPPGSAPDQSIGFMPMGNMPLCCQKLDAIERWITAGAPSN